MIQFPENVTPVGLNEFVVDAGVGWPEPQPLPEGLPPVAQFDFDLLPDKLGPWAEDIVERIGCAPDYVAVSIMTGLGAVVGKKIGVRPQNITDWLETANMWAMVIGRPGVLKSPAIEATLAPIKRLMSQSQQAYEVEMASYQEAAIVAKLREEAGMKAAKTALAKDPRASVNHLLPDLPGEEAPVLRRYMAVNTTAEALGELHIHNPNGLLVHRDEMVSLLRSLDQEDKSEARGFYLTGWNGNSAYTFDRIGRGLNLHIPAVCLSMLGSTQPGKIASYVRHAVKGGSGDDGLIQRFGLLVWPDNNAPWKDVDRRPDGAARQMAFKVYERLDKMTASDVRAYQDVGVDGQPDGIPYLRFDEGGLAMFREWREVLEARLRGGQLHPAMESHLAKYRKLIPGLALLLHLADDGIGPISEKATVQALGWGEYLETHANRAYASVLADESSAAKAILQRLRNGDLAQQFSSREVWRNGWAMLADREEVQKALSLMVDLDWIGVSRRETAGRTATVYTVNPRALQ
jgi:putative DNA primase/helicase